MTYSPRSISPSRRNAHPAATATKIAAPLPIKANPPAIRAVLSSASPTITYMNERIGVSHG